MRATEVPADRSAPPGEPLVGHAPAVGHVNYSFFHSTQSFIYFYMSRLERVRPICLTRARESPTIADAVPPALAGDFHVYTGERGDGRVADGLWRSGVALRRALTRLPPRLAEPALGRLARHAVPRLRGDADPRRFLDWAERILRARDARLIHAYFGPVGWRTLELKRRLGLPLVVTFLGDDIAPVLAPWWSWWIADGHGEPDWPARLRELFEHADLLLVEGPHLRERVIELGCEPDKVEVQRIAIPLEEISFRPACPPADGKAAIVFAGRFCEQKGVLYALDAVRRLRAQRRDFELRLIGDDTLTDGRYAARVHAFIREHRLQDCVRLLGFLNHDRYLAELRRGDIFLHPSIVDDAGISEGGAPTTILEAQAVGLPVVSTLHCDIPAVTVPGESALLVPERDGRALADALGTLLDDPGRWEAMGRAGRGHVEAHHDISIEAAGLEDRYFALLGATART